MKIAVVNPFDPLPGEGIRPGRYAGFCAALVSRGHDVRWYSSAFSHALKAPRDGPAIDRAAAGEGLEVVLLPARPYRRNIGPARAWNHRQLRRRLWGAATAPGAFRPDVVLVSLPTPGLGREAAAWADRCGARLVVDVQDLWPETFGRLLPPLLRPLGRAALMGMTRSVRATYRRADAVVGVARQYVDHARPWVRPAVPLEVLPLGVDLAGFDRSVAPAGEVGLEKPAGEKWLFLGGAISGYVDLDGTVAMMVELRRRGRDDVRLMVVGTGPAEQRLRAAVRRENLAGVRLFGQRSYRFFVSLAAACDAAICPIRPDACVYFPNRAFDCFAAGLPILNTSPGELADVLAEHEAGITVATRDPRAWADAAEMLLARGAPGPAGRGTWVRQYDRPAVAARLAELVESL